MLTEHIAGQKPVKFCERVGDRPTALQFGCTVELIRPECSRRTEVEKMWDLNHVDNPVSIHAIAAIKLIVERIEFIFNIAVFENNPIDIPVSINFYIDQSLRI